MWRRLLLTAPVIFSLLGLLAGAQCFPRQCRSHLNCERLCDCNDASNGTVVQCPMFFRCDVQNGICADEYNMGCDELCGRYAARDVCGSKTCSDESECVRQALCEARDPQTGALICSYTCEVTFACDPEAGACEAAFGLDDGSLCASALCPIPQGGACG